MNTKITTHTMVSVALMVAIASVLHMITLFHMPQGGSVTAGTMVPLLLLSYRYGPFVGMLGGLLYGMVNLMQDPFIVHPVQVLFDYPLPFMCLGIAGFKIRNSYLPSLILAVVCRCACHVFSGVVFFASYAPADTSPLMYSLIFNATYLIPDTIICMLILKFLPLNRLLDAMK